MTDGNLIPIAGDGNTPIVFERAGRVFANSRDVAAFFEKRHDNVLRDIDNLLKNIDSSILRSGMFVEVMRPDAHGINRAAFDMTRDGFMLLAMGFTGAKALEFKLRYIERFNAMEARLRRAAADPVAMLNDPAAMRGLLLTYTEKVIALEAKVKEQAPKVEALDRIAGADGLVCVTNAAKDLQMRPKDLFAWLTQNRWIYKRPGNAGHIAYQDKIQSGYLTHKVTTVSRSDGTERLAEQVVVTPKGMAKLARLLMSVAAE